MIPELHLVVSSHHLEYGWRAGRRAVGAVGRKDKVLSSAGKGGNGAGRRQKSMQEAQVTHRPIYDCTGIRCPDNLRTRLEIRLCLAFSAKGSLASRPSIAVIPPTGW